MSSWQREKHPGVGFLRDFHAPPPPPPSVPIFSPAPSSRERLHEIHHETQTREPVHSLPKSKVFSWNTVNYDTLRTVTDVIYKWD